MNAPAIDAPAINAIVTLTLNASVDVQWEVDKMAPTEKIRASEPLSFAGGGGINVSRVIRVLGGTSIAVMTAGWMSGHFLRELVEAHGLLTRVIPIAGRTRVSATAYERATGQEYRLTPPGPELSEPEWQACLDAVFEFGAGIIVATGSLPRGVPTDFYRRLARRAKASGIKVVLDTSGEALSEAVDEGVFLVKPNRRELEHLTGRSIQTPADQEALSRQLVDAGKAEIVALTLGADGALLATSAGTQRLPSIDVPVKSAVGAGDSFVGGITLGLARGWPAEDAFALGVATATATVLTAGTELCRRDDVERLFEQVSGKPLAL